MRAPRIRDQAALQQRELVLLAGHVDEHDPRGRGCSRSQLWVGAARLDVVQDAKHWRHLW